MAANLESKNRRQRLPTTEELDVVGRYALLVGTDEYQDPGLSRLSAPVDDIERLARVLRDPQRGAFESVSVMINRPSYELLVAIEELAADRTPDDLVLLYLSCHGVKDHRGRLCFAAVNTQLRRLAATSVTAAYVNDQLGDVTLGARSRVLLLDCCFSGGFAEGLAAKSADTGVLADMDGAGYVVMTASDAYSPAYEESTAEARSIFTDVVVEGLLSGAADVDGDGLVSTNDLFDYAFPIVSSRSGQRPNYLAANLEGRIVLAHAGGSRSATTQPASAPRTVSKSAAPQRHFPTWETYVNKINTLGPESDSVDDHGSPWALTALGGPLGLATRLVAVDPEALPAVLLLITGHYSAPDPASGVHPPQSVLIERAWRAAKHGWWEEAQTQFAAAVRHEPLSVPAWWGMGCCHGIANAWSRAMESFTKAARYAAAGTLSLTAGATLLAVAAAELGGLPGADRLLRDALTMAPDCPELIAAAALQGDDSHDLATAAERDPLLLLALAVARKPVIEHYAESKFDNVLRGLEERADQATQAWEDLRRSAATARVELPHAPARHPAAGVLNRAVAAFRTIAEVGGMRTTMAAVIHALPKSKPPEPPPEPQGWRLTSKHWDAYEAALEAHTRQVHAYKRSQQQLREQINTLDNLEHQTTQQIAAVRAGFPTAAHHATIVPR